MVKNKNQIRNVVELFFEKVKSHYPIKNIILYGSYAKNSAKENSDIDIAVIIDLPDHLKRIDITSDLFHYAGGIDVDLEPKCVFYDEYLHHDKASILAEILRTGEILI